MNYKKLEKMYQQDNYSDTTIKPVELEDKTSNKFDIEEKVASSSRVQLPIRATGLPEISADNFEESSSSIMREMDQFFRYNDASAFPKAVIQQGIYKVLRERIYKLYDADSKKYDKLLETPEFSKTIEKFIDLEDEIFKNNSYREVDQKPSLEQNDSYQEIAQETTLEQDV
jgi:hypothetical protein